MSFIKNILNNSQPTEFDDDHLFDAEKKGLNRLPCWIKADRRRLSVMDYGQSRVIWIDDQECDSNIVRLWSRDNQNVSDGINKELNPGENVND